MHACGKRVRLAQRAWARPVHQVAGRVVPHQVAHGLDAARATSEVAQEDEDGEEEEEEVEDSSDASSSDEEADDPPRKAAPPKRLRAKRHKHKLPTQPFSSIPSASTMAGRGRWWWCDGGRRSVGRCPPGPAARGGRDVHTRRVGGAAAQLPSQKIALFHRHSSRAPITVRSVVPVRSY